MGSVAIMQSSDKKKQMSLPVILAFQTLVPIILPEFHRYYLADEVFLPSFFSDIYLLDNRVFHR